MSTLTLPVPWTDGDKKGLKGVIEVHNDELPHQKFEGSRVSDLTALLNKKINDILQHENRMRTVESIQLHGVNVGEACLLESLIPDLESSVPRLVAKMRAIRPARTGQRLQVFVRTLTDKTLTLACKTDDVVGYLKHLILRKERIPVNQQRLVFVSKELDDHRKLSFYNIQNESTLHLVLRLRGGIDGIMAAETSALSFVDVSDGSRLVERKFSSKAPEWRRCAKGLNIEGYCENGECNAYKSMIIDPQGFKFFNLMKEKYIVCPECYSNVEPITCGFYDCVWKFEGVKESDLLSISSRWKEAKGGKYHRFDESCGSVDWSSLLIIAKPLEISKATLLTSKTSPIVKANDMCTLCWSNFGPSLGKLMKTSYDCRHTFHRSCASVWSEWCEKINTLPSCPLCHKHGATIKLL